MSLNIQDFINLASEVKEIRHSIEKVNGENLHIFCYMIATPELFKNPLERECRGIVFNDNGDCLCRPYHKFFSIGEKEETLPQNINWGNIVAITNKVDGSLLTPVSIKGQIFWKTKKSFYSNIAQIIQSKWDKRDWWYNGVNFLIQSNITEYTLLFEYLSPDNRIVIEYKEEDLFYLGKRNITTGLYEVNEYNTHPKLLPIVDYSTFIDKTRSLEGEEGYVLYNSLGEAYKIKTQWYMDRHHLLSSLSYREIFKMIAAETIDDILAELRLKTFISQVNLIEALIVEYKNIFTELWGNVLNAYASIRKKAADENITLIKKEYALIVNKDYKELSSFLFCYYDENTDKLFELLTKNVTNTLIEKYKGRVLFMGEEQ